MKYKHVLVAIELSDDSKELIDRAKSFAEEFGSYISFIHLDGTHGEIYPELMDLVEDPDNHPLQDSKLEKLQSLVDYLGEPLRHNIVGTGELSDKLESAIYRYRIDLVICGHHHDFWSKIVSYSKHLIDKSPVDLLVVPIDK